MNLSTPVRFVMTRDVVVADVTDPPSRLRSLFDQRRFHHLPVVRGDVIVGILSASDLARAALDGWVDRATADAHLDEAFTVESLMTFEPEVVREDDTIGVAADKLASGEFHALPVVDGRGHVVGMVTSTDLIRFLLASR